jgi:hypothetical protein
MNNTFDYYKNPIILTAIKYETDRIRGQFDKEECKQEIFAELYDFMPLDDEEALKLVYRVGRRYRRSIKEHYCSTGPHNDDWFPVANGWQRKCHTSPAD